MTDEEKEGLTNFLIMSDRFKVERDPAFLDMDPPPPREDIAQYMLVGRKGCIRTLPDNMVEVMTYPGELRAFRRIIRCNGVDYDRTTFDRATMCGRIVISVTELEYLLGEIKVYVNVRNDQNFRNNAPTLYLKVTARCRARLADRRPLMEQELKDIVSVLGVDRARQIISEYACFHPIPELAEEVTEDLL